MIDEEFLGNIDSTFICQTAAILSGNFINNVAFTCASSKGKTNNADLQFAKVSGSLGASAPRHPDTLENCKYSMG